MAAAGEMMPDSRFLVALQERVILGDGAYGTEFLRRGCLLERPFDEMNLTRPLFVLDLHREYVAAGVELIKTNTFMANRLRLKKHGLEDKTREINLAGARLAREAAPRRVFVAGSVGPLTEFPEEGKHQAFEEQCQALAEGDCDLLLLETFTQEDDLVSAYFAARETGLPVACQMAVLNGRRVTRLATALGEPRADLVGVNCVSGLGALGAVKQIGEFTTVPRSAFPDGGLPDRPVPPDEFAEGIRLLVEAGVRLVGGCCGTGPDHIRAAAKVLGRGR